MGLDVVSLISSKPFTPTVPLCASIYGSFSFAEVLSTTKFREKASSVAGKIAGYGKLGRDSIESASERFLFKNKYLYYIMLFYLFCTLFYIAFFKDIEELDKVDVLLNAVTICIATFIVRFSLKEIFARITLARIIYHMLISFIICFLTVFMSNNIGSFFHLAELRAGKEKFRFELKATAVMVPTGLGPNRQTIVFFLPDDGIYPLGSESVDGVPDCGDRVDEFLKIQQVKERGIEFKSDEIFSCFETNGKVALKSADIIIQLPVDLDTAQIQFLHNDTDTDRIGSSSFFGLRTYFGYMGKNVHLPDFYLDVDRYDKTVRTDRLEKIMKNKVKAYSSLIFSPDVVAGYTILILNIFAFSDAVVVLMFQYIGNSFRGFSEDAGGKPLESMGRVLAVIVGCALFFKDTFAFVVTSFF